MTSSRVVAAMAALSLALASVSPAYAQAQPSAQALETARNLFKEGKDLRAKGDLQGALEKFQAAHALGNTPVTGIELARTYVMVGKIVEAREVCLGIARTPVASDETERSAEARTDAATLAEQLKPRIPTLVVRVQGLVNGEAAALVIDGVAVPAAAATAPQKVNPGKHVVVAKAGDGRTAREARTQAEIGEAQTREVTVVLPPPPAGETGTGTGAIMGTGTGTTGERKHRTSLTTVGLVIGGIGAAAGTIAGVAAMSKKSTLDQECTGGADHHGCTSPQAQSDHSSAVFLASMSDIAFGVAGVGAAIAIIGVLTGSGSNAGGGARPQGTGSAARIAPWIGPGSAGVHGSF
jgi:hypothetical protein